MYTNQRLKRAIQVMLIATLMFIKGCSQVDVDEPLRIGISPWPGFDIIYYAEYKELFKQAGLNVQLNRFDNMEDSSRAFLRGQLDAVYSSSWDVMQLPITEDDIHVVLITNISSGADGVVGAPDIKNVEGLVGKKVACQVGVVSHTILMEALRLHGIDSDLVELVDVSNELGREMLLRGEVDAAVLWEPLLSKTAEQLAGNILFTTKEITSDVVDNLLTRKNLTNEKREKLKQFIAIWFQITDEIQKNPESVLTEIANYIDAPPDEFIKGYAGMTPGDLALNHAMLGEAGELNNVFNSLAETMSSFTKDINTNVYSSPEYLPKQN